MQFRGHAAETHVPGAAASPSHKFIWKAAVFSGGFNLCIGKTALFLQQKSD